MLDIKTHTKTDKTRGITGYRKHDTDETIELIDLN